MRKPPGPGRGLSGILPPSFLLLIRWYGYSLSSSVHAIFEQLLEDVSFNAGDESMPPFELAIDGKYVNEHLKGENKPMDIKKYIL